MFVKTVIVLSAVTYNRDQVHMMVIEILQPLSRNTVFIIAHLEGSSGNLDPFEEIRNS